MASSNNPRQLKMSCTVSAIYLPEIGSQAGFNSRTRLQPDPSNTLSASLKEQIDRSIYSSELGLIATGSGGFIPKLNLNIGAPAATFIEGQIVPNQTHPVLNLLKGAVSSNFNPEITYFVPSNSPTSNAQSSSATLPSTTGVASPFTRISSPIIPSAKLGPYTGLNAITTYNIWTQKNITSAKRTNAKYLLNYGITNYAELGGVTSFATIQNNGSKVNVKAISKPCVMSRIFPIADDLLYENDVKIYYPETNGIIKTPDLVEAKGGPNCGFWIHIDLNLAGVKTTNSTHSAPQLMIYWGSPKSKDLDKYFTEFVLIFPLNKKPTLRYKTPNSISNSIKNIQTNWGKIDLDGEELLQSSKFIDIFVHYAGPNMYIGFSTDVSKWNVIEPIRVTQLTEVTSDDTFWQFFQQKDAIIEMYFENMSASFTYSPICFNNFNSQELKTSSSDTSNKIKANINVSKKEYDNGSFTEQKIVENFYKFREPNNIVDPAAEKQLPTFYGDWRRAKTTEVLYEANPEIKYKELSHSNDTILDDNPRTNIQAQIYYNTTIEGPIFFYLRNFPDAEQRSKILRTIWNNLSDISSYLRAANVRITYGEETKNKSYKKSLATLTFANLTNDIIGIQILNAIQENVLVFTLKAGYDKLETFYQGVSTNITVSRTPDSFDIQVVCQDLGDTLLSNIRFNTTSNITFSDRQFKGIFEDCFYMAGLSKVYKPREEKTSGYDILYKKFFKNFIGQPGRATSLLRFVMTVNKTVKIKQPILELLKLMIYDVENFQKGEIKGAAEGLPVLYWDPEKENYILTLRADEPVDELFFAGDSTEPNIYLANRNVDREHGIVTAQGWEEKTVVDNLHSSTIFFAKLLDGTVTFLESDPSVKKQALSASSLNDLNNFVKNPSTETNLGNFQDQPVIGYVGFHKEFLVSEDVNKMIQDETFAREQFKIRETVTRNTFTSITLNILVTKPLHSNGTFKIKSFQGGTENTTSNFIYDTVIYNFDINTNLITATVTGVKFPEFI